MCNSCGSREFYIVDADGKLQGQTIWHTARRSEVINRFTLDEAISRVTGWKLDGANILKCVGYARRQPPTIELTIS